MVFSVEPSHFIDNETETKLNDWSKSWELDSLSASLKHIVILLSSQKGQIFLLRKHLYRIKYLVNLTHTHTVLDQQYNEDISTLCIKLSKQKPHNHFVSVITIIVHGMKNVNFFIAKFRHWANWFSVTNVKSTICNSI